MKSTVGLPGVGPAPSWTENRGSAVSGNRTRRTHTTNKGSCSWATSEGIGFRLHSRRPTGFHDAGRRRRNRSRTTAGLRRRSCWSPDTADFGYHSGNRTAGWSELGAKVRDDPHCTTAFHHRNVNSCRSKTTRDLRDNSR